MLPRIPFADALYWVPSRGVNVTDLSGRLIVRYEKRDENSLEDDHGSVEDETPSGGEVVEIHCYSLAKRGYIGVPRAFGLQHFAGKPFVDRSSFTVVPVERWPQGVFKPRDEDQAKFWYDLDTALSCDGPVDIVANAATGAGKTVTAARTIVDSLQTPTLITVPTNNLRNQWVNDLRGFFGDEWVRQNVGHIQQNKTDYRGKLITVGLAPSLALRDYPQELQRHFGAIFFDEWHKIGAPKMHQILHKYPARIRIGLTATNRIDALYKLCTLHLGKPRVISQQRMLSPLVYTVNYNKTLPRQMEVHSSWHLTSLLSRFRDRNMLLAYIIYELGYRRERNVVFLSDRREQLYKLMGILIKMGVPESDVGLFLGQYAEKMNKKQIAEEQARVAGTCKLIGATYGVFDTGSNIPRLDMGVECTPRGNIRQAIGRVLRILPGKPQPEWYSLNDTIYRFVNTGLSLWGDTKTASIPELENLRLARLKSFEFQRAIMSELEVSNA